MEIILEQLVDELPAVKTIELSGSLTRGVHPSALTRSPRDGQSGRRFTPKNEGISQDPQVNTTGLLPGFLSAEGILGVEPMSSPFTLDISQTADGGPNLAHKQSPIHGHVSTHGIAGTDGTADVQIDFDLTIEEMHFKLGNQNVDLVYILGSGGTGPTPIHVDSSGMATIPMGQLDLTLDFTQNGQRSRLPILNDHPLKATIDFPNKTFHIPSIPFDSKQGITGNLELSGTIDNQAPVAVSKPDQVVECTSPAGATVKLDGSDTTDPDSNIEKFSWSLGFGLERGKILSNNVMTSTVAPIGTSLYTLQVIDQRFQIALARTNVTVQDMTPPVLTVSATPTCLWSPNHELVLYELQSSDRAKLA